MRSQLPTLCLSPAAHIPATAGGHTVVDGGLLFPCAAVSTVTTVVGRHAVDLELVGTCDGGLELSPAEARALAAVLCAAADTAELGTG